MEKDDTPIHPFVGEGFTAEEMIGFWDDIADRYTSVQQGNMPQRIVDHLKDEGIISEDKNVIELGSGPGTYTLRISPIAKSITCLDTSPKMIRRLMRSAEELDLRNIKTECVNFMDYKPEIKFSTLVSSMCPGAGSVEGILKSEEFSKEYCAYVSWIDNNWDDLHAEVWKNLGRNYSFAARKTNFFKNRLDEMGRNPESLEFSEKIEMKFDLEELISKEVEEFSVYGLNDDIEDAIRSVYEPMSKEGVVHYNKINRIGLVIWTPKVIG